MKICQKIEPGAVDVGHMLAIQDGFGSCSVSSPRPKRCSWRNGRTRSTRAD